MLRQGKSPVLKNLKKEMKIFVQYEKFEEAAKLRNQIQSLEKVMSHTHGEIGGQQSWPYRRVEAYDVSNIQGKEATGAMVTFIKGQPDKNFYRRFKIKTVGQANDVAMIKEILKRRLKHAEWGLPDLILIDGGKAQLNAAMLITKNYKLKTKVMAIAKRENKLYVEGRKKPVLLKTMPREIFNLILQLRDEAHRFARSYHLKLRYKSLLG
jgi:excinuclease ABC subunit C